MQRLMRTSCGGLALAAAMLAVVVAPRAAGAGEMNDAAGAALAPTPATSTPAAPSAPSNPEQARSANGSAPPGESAANDDAAADVVPARPAYVPKPAQAELWLATQYVRAGQRLLIMAELPTPEAVAATALLMHEALVLQPDDVELWRMMIGIARLMEDENLLNVALANVSRLDPADEVVALMRINERIDQLPSMDERVAAYETLLSEANRTRIGPALASRLAYDLALLQRRAGNTDEFAKWLSEAVALDPSHRAAVEMAAGFFRMYVNDPYADAELMASALMSNPCVDAKAVALGQLLLDQGAYAGADRLHELAIAIREANYQKFEPEMLADCVIAKWGKGDPVGAQKLVDARQAEVNQMARNDAWVNDPLMHRDALGAVRGEMGLTLQTTKAALYNRRFKDRAAAALASCLQSYEKARKEVELEPEVNTPEIRARLALDPVWLAVWLGDDKDQVRAMLAHAETVGALTPGAKQRFDGCLAYKEARYDEAVALLAPLAETDRIARLALGLNRIAMGERSAGAADLLSVMREAPGTLLGVWCADYLQELLGQPVPPTELAQRLDRLVASIPRSIDDYPGANNLAVGLVIIPDKQQFDAFEPIGLTIELTNKTTIPLAIDEVGPIRPELILNPSVRLPRLPRFNATPPIVTEVDRRFRLMPREKLTMRLDMRRYEISDILNSLPFSGGMLQVKGTSNVLISKAGATMPMMLSGEYETPPFRINGARISMEWLKDSIEAIPQMVRARDLGALAMLGAVLSAGVEDATPVDQRALVEAGVQQFTAAFPSLDDVSQAWLISVLPPSPEMEPIFAMARVSESPHVQLVYLIHRTHEVGDPMLDAGRRSPHAPVREMAGLLDEVLQQRERMRRAAPREEPATP